MYRYGNNGLVIFNARVAIIAIHSPVKIIGITGLHVGSGLRLQYPFKGEWQN